MTSFNKTTTTSVKVQTTTGTGGNTEQGLVECTQSTSNMDILNPEKVVISGRRYRKLYFAEQNVEESRSASQQKDERLGGTLSSQAAEIQDLRPHALPMTLHEIIPPEKPGIFRLRGNLLLSFSRCHIHCDIL